jgi:hypothetical protein
MNDTTHHKNKRVRWITAAACLLFFAAAAAIVLAAGSGNPRHPAGTSTGEAKSASGPAAGPSTGISQAQDPCQTATPSDTIPTQPPRDLVWRNVGAVLVPVSAAEGPARYAGPAWSCYAHSPMGAVLASYGIFAALTSPGWHAVAERQIVPGTGQQAFIRAGEHQGYRPPQPGQVAQPVGFTVVSYTPQQATTEALADPGNGQYQVNQRTVAWVNGDWKLVVTPDGRTGPDPQLVSSAAGFVLWGGGHA